MPGHHFLCVDCFDHLKQLVCSSLVMYYCDNRKCRRFGVLTLGALEDSRCQKVICDLQQTPDILPKD